MQSSLATGRAPTLGRARVAPSASSRSNLGAGRAMRGFGSESLRGSGRAAGVTLPRRRAATPCRAKTLEERIASGEFTKPRSSPAEDLLNGFRGLIRNVDNPQGECRDASRTKPRAHDGKIRRLSGLVPWAGWYPGGSVPWVSFVPQGVQPTQGTSPGAPVRFCIP